MKKDDWDDIIKEPMSEELKSRTMARARQELDALEPEKGPSALFWLIPVIPGLAALLLFIKHINKEESSNRVAMGEEDYLEELNKLSIEELEDLDVEMLANLEFYQDLDVLEEWDGRDEV